MPTISEIQDYLTRHMPTEDERIDPKTKERTMRAVAENVKANKELPKGRCNACGWEDDRLIPATMKICLACCKKFMDRGGELQVIKKDIEDYHCEFCQSRTFHTFYVNPLLCHKCSQKVGRRHKYNNAEVLKEKKRIRQDKIRRGAIIAKEGDQ